jgi:hypothetical protein
MTLLVLPCIALAFALVDLGLPAATRPTGSIADRPDGILG